MEQAAQKLGLSVRQVEAMISSGELPVVAVGNRRVLRATIVNGLSKKSNSSDRNDATSKRLSGVSSASAGTESTDYYTDVEVAKKLDKPHLEIYRMANLGELPVKFVDDKRMFPKDAIDHLATQTSQVGEATVQPNHEGRALSGNNRTSGSTTHSQASTTVGEYFSPDQLAYALQKPVEDIERMIRRSEVKTETIGGQTWIPRQQVEKIIDRRQESRQSRIRKRLPEPHVLAPQRNGPVQGRGRTDQEDSRARDDHSTVNVSERAVMKAAQAHSTSINKVRQMVADGKLVVHPGSGLLVAPEELDKMLSGRGDQDRLSGTTDARRSENPPAVSGDADPASASLEDKVKGLENDKQALINELDHEKTWRAKDLADAQHEIDQLDIQLENLRSTKDRTIENLGANVEELELKVRDLDMELEHERERREEAEHTVGSLQPLQEDERGVSTDLDRKTDEDRGQPTSGQQNPVRDFLETFGKNVRDALGADEPDEDELTQLREQFRHELEGREKDRLAAQYDYAQLENLYKDLGEQNRTLKDEINDIKVSMSGSPTREELEVKLDWNEARRRDLEKSLALEKQRTRQLETDSRTLAEIQRLLTGDAPRSAGSAATSSPPETPNEVSDVPDSDILRIQTRHGLWIFRPPFALESDEVELIRLVAGEDEISAKQITHKTGRRRSADDLDELLDRLHSEGMEPIKESNDRYSFDPDFLQD